MPPLPSSTLFCTIPRTLPLRTPLTLVRHGGSSSADWKGRQSDEHITNRDDNLNVQASASKSGKSERAAGAEGASGATSEEDKGNQNEQAQKDHPEAPGPVIGMNDERGGVSILSECCSGLRERR